MANENDGSIIIDTELDTTGFEKGSDKLTKAISEAANTFDNFGDNVMNSFGKVIPLLQSIAGSASQISAALTGTATQTEAATERVVDSEQHVKQSAEEAAAAVNKQGEAASSFSGSVNATQGSVTALEREVNSLSSSLQSVSNSAEMGFANGKAVIAFDTKLQEMEQRLATTREHLEAFGNAQMPTEEYTSLVQQVEKAEQALFKLYDRRDDMQALGVKENSAQWQRLALQIQNAEEQLSRYKRSRDSLTANGTAFVNGAETAEYAQMKAALDTAEAAIDRNKSLINQEALEQARLNVLTAQEAVEAAKSTRRREIALERLRTAQQQLNDLASSMSGGNAVQDKWNNMITLSGQLRASFERIKEAASMAFTAITHPIQAADRLLGAFTAKAKSVAKTLAKLPFQALAKGVKKLSDGFKNFIKNSYKARTQSDALVKSLTSLKRMLITRIKRMFISAIFNEAKESLQTLAKFSDAFNQSMSNIKNSSKQLSGNLAVSLGNLVNTLAPMITGLLDTISKAITYLNALFAMLSGKSTMTVAKKQTDSYRDSLDGAAKSAEELKNQVYGFDELNKRNDDSSKNSGVTDGSDLFEEVPIDSVLPDSLKETFEELKKLWENEEYFDFGRKLAELFNGAVQTVDDWINTTLRPKGTEWSKTIAEILNGLVDGFNGYALGKTLADGLNTVLDVANTFLTTFNFTALGQLIGNGINGIFENVEFDLLGQTLANKFNAFTDTLYGLVTTIQWGMIGDQLATGIQSLADTANFDRLGEAVGIGVNGVLTAINHLQDGVFWGEIASNFAGGVQTFLDTCNVNLLADTISTAVNDAVNILNKFGDGIDWEGNGEKLGNGINRMIGGVNWEGLGNMLSTAVSNLLSIINSTIENTQWQDVGGAVAKGVNGIQWSTVISEIARTVNDIRVGLLDLAIGFIEEMEWWRLGNQIWDSVVGVVQNTQWGDILSKAFELLGAAVGGAIALAGGIFEGIGQSVIDAILGVQEYFKQKIEDAGGDIIAGILKGITDALVSIGTWIHDNIFTPFWNGIKNAFGIHSPSTKMAEIGGFLIEGLKQGITKAWTSITGFFTQTLPQLANTISQKWDNIKATATQKWSDIKSTVTTKWNSLKSTLTSTDWKSVGSNLVSGLKSGIESRWNDLKTSVKTLGSKLTGWLEEKFDINSPSKVWAEIGEYLDLGLKQGLEDEQKGVLKTVSNLAKSVTDEFDVEEATLQIGTETNGMVSHLSGIADKLSGIVAAFRGINEYLSNIEALRIPYIATGEEIPYKTRISASTEPSSTVLEMSSDLDETLSDHSYLLRRILELLERAKFGIDNDELAQAIAFALRGATRGYGGA